MLNFPTFAVYCVGLYCFSKLYWDFIDSNVERESLRRKLRAAVEEKRAKANKEEEEEVRRMVSSRRSEKKRELIISF